MSSLVSRLHISERVHRTETLELKKVSSKQRCRLGRGEGKQIRCNAGQPGSERPVSERRQQGGERLLSERSRGAGSGSKHHLCRRAKGACRRRRKWCASARTVAGEVALFRVAAAPLCEER